MRRKSALILFVSASAALLSSAKASVLINYNSDGFEPVGGFQLNQNLKGQGNLPSWKVRTTAVGAVGASTATIQSSVVYAGGQALQITEVPADGDTWYAPVTTPVVQSGPLADQYLNISWEENVPAGALSDPFYGVYAFNSQYPLGYAGIDGTTGQIQISQASTGVLLTPTATPVVLGKWNSFDIQLNYQNSTETVFVNGNAISTQGFITPSTNGFTDADITSIGTNALQTGSGNAYFDNYMVSSSTTAYSPPANLTWTNASGGGDGTTWDVGISANFNNGATQAAFNNGDNVLFNDSNNGHYLVQISGQVAPGSVVVANNSSTYTLSGTGGISGVTSLVKTGSGGLTLATTNNYSGGTFVNAGTLTLASAGALPADTMLNISSGAQLVVSSHGSNPIVVLDVNTLSNAGLINLEDNNLIVESASALASVNQQVGKGYNGGGWNGTSGITSGAAAGDSMHLTALGVILNDNGSGSPLYGSGTRLGTFDGANPADGDVLVKYTYYGDTNLKGYVDGTDYQRIDNAYLGDLANPHAYTGWYNGDFNYDGVIDGSDYTLMDNAYNNQGAKLTASIAPFAVSTAEIAGNSTTSSVPEPANLLPIVGFALLSICFRRRRGLEG